MPLQSILLFVLAALFEIGGAWRCGRACASAGG